MTEETKNLLMRHGLSKQQVESRALNMFVELAGERQGLLDKEIVARNRELEEQNTKLAVRLMNAETTIETTIIKAGAAQAELERLTAEKEHLQAEIEALRETKLNESIDDAKTRNFMALIEWLDENYNEQQIKSFCNIGKGFFGGWIDPPAEIANNKPKPRPKGDLHYKAKRW